MHSCNSLWRGQITPIPCTRHAVHKIIFKWMWSAWQHTTEMRNAKCKTTVFLMQWPVSSGPQQEEQRSIFCKALPHLSMPILSLYHLLTTFHAAHSAYCTYFHITGQPSRKGETRAKHTGHGTFGLPLHCTSPSGAVTTQLQTSSSRFYPHSLNNSLHRGDRCAI